MRAGSTTSVTSVWPAGACRTKLDSRKTDPTTRHFGRNKDHPPVPHRAAGAVPQIMAGRTAGESHTLLESHTRCWRVTHEKGTVTFSPSPDPPPVPRIAGGADRGLPVGPAVLVPPPARAFSLVRRGSGGAATRDFTVRVDGARRRRSLGRGRSLLPQLPLRVPAASGDLVDLDPAGRARVDLGDPGIRLAAIPALGLPYTHK